MEKMCRISWSGRSFHKKNSSLDRVGYIEPRDRKLRHLLFSSGQSEGDLQVEFKLGLGRRT